MANQIVNKYWVRMKSARQTEVIQLFNKAFHEWTRDIVPLRFNPSDYCYATIYLIDGETAQLIIGTIQPSASFFDEAIQLQAYTDVSMLPLMDVGIRASKLHG